MIINIAKKRSAWLVCTRILAIAVLTGFSVPEARAIGLLIPKHDAAAIARGHAFAAPAAGLAAANRSSS